MSDIRILFAIPEDCKNETECSEIMLQAFEACKSNVANVSWIVSSALATEDLTKTDFVVFQDFKGAHFENLKAKDVKSARIVGPWCVSICLMEGRSIPNFPWPIYNVAMSDCVVSCSHLPKAKKLEIKEKVQLMGGAYTESFMTTNTHLITDSVKSEKYIQAAEKGVKLMLADWVSAVWEASQRSNVHANGEQFKEFKCLPFHNLTICSTGLPNLGKRQELARDVHQNGGVFTGSLSLNKTDILVVYGSEGVLSAKFKAARQNENVSCVSIDWIFDSIEKGYALPREPYVIKRITSTPNKDDRVDPSFSNFSNSSMVSAIGDTTCRSTVDESCLNRRETTFKSKMLTPPSKRKCSNDYSKLIDGLDVKKAKMAGQYLDGCSVYILGFSTEQREKLCKILNLSGATRYDDISDRLTHIIVGDTSCPELKIIRSKRFQACLVSINWLLESIEKQRPVDEENHLIPLSDVGTEQFSSPLTRKGVSLLRSDRTMTSDNVQNDEVTLKNGQGDDGADAEIMQQYMQSSSQNPEADTLDQLLKNADSEFLLKENAAKEATLTSQSQPLSLTSQDESSQVSFNFRGKKFKLEKFPPEEAETLKVQIEDCLGTILPKSYMGIPDYLVAPMFIKDTIQSPALEIVSETWIMESIDEEQFMPILYYHRPFVMCDGTPLENCVVTISGFPNYERMFLKRLVENLGGVLQDQFARITSEKKGILGSTHLVSFEAKGKKYDAALKWGFPVVGKEWLFECAKTGRLVAEEAFLIGDSKVTRKFSASESSTSESTSSTVTATSAQKANSRVLTPKNIKEPLNISTTNDKTPVNQRLFKNCKGGDEFSPCSQVTPINKIMEEVRRTNLLGTPATTPQIPKTWYSVDTPESPFGKGIDPQMTPNSKKELLRFFNRFPDFQPPPVNKARKLSTPLSEVKRRCWAKLLGTESQSQASTSGRGDVNEGDSSHLDSSQKENNSEDKLHDNDDSPGGLCPRDLPSSGVQQSTQNMSVGYKLKQLETLVDSNSSCRRNSRGFSSTVPAAQGNSEGKESQPYTVTWDYKDNVAQQNPQIRMFMISGVENDLRQGIVEKIERLGAQVSDLSTYDPVCTHMICPKPARNEKTLSCMASGKWILHLSYIDKSLEAGRFLNEEEFEFGNPKSAENIRIKFDKEGLVRCESMHWWRKEIARRGYKPFNDMRAIVVASKRDPIIRVIEAGGGTVVDAKPPFREPVHATHCLLEPRSVQDFSLYNPLAQQGIYCVNTLYISDFLHRVNKDIRDLILPQFSEFY